MYSGTNYVQIYLKHKESKKYKNYLLLGVSGEVLPDIFRNIFFQFIALDDGYMLGKPYAEPPWGDATVDVGGQAPSHAFLVNLFKERLAERILFDNDVLCREVKFKDNTERL